GDSEPEHQRALPAPRGAVAGHGARRRSRRPGRARRGQPGGGRTVNHDAPDLNQGGKTQVTATTTAALYESYERESKVTVLPEGVHRLEVIGCTVKKRDGRDYALFPTFRAVAAE